MILNDPHHSSSKLYKKVVKAFDKYSTKVREGAKLSKKSNGKDSKDIEKLLNKVKKVASKALVKEQKKASTQNSERLLRSVIEDSENYNGSLR